MEEGIFSSFSFQLFLFGDILIGVSKQSLRDHFVVGELYQSIASNLHYYSYDEAFDFANRKTVYITNAMVKILPPLEILLYLDCVDMTAEENRKLYGSKHFGKFLKNGEYIYLGWEKNLMNILRPFSYS